MVTLEESIHELVDDNPLAPLHKNQIFVLLKNNGFTGTFEEVDKACDCIFGKDLFMRDELPCFSVAK